jgi:hypothetical protein
MSATAERIDYLNPEVPAALPWHELPLIEASAHSLRGYGMLVDDPRDFPIEIVTWPKPDGRPVDPGTGNEAGPAPLIIRVISSAFRFSKRF